jgi:predicted ATPase/DNA-binding CsgD family transcriptional regulator/tetratricopeptide (TPR) repeat protein
MCGDAVTREMRRASERSELPPCRTLDPQIALFVRQYVPEVTIRGSAHHTTQTPFEMDCPPHNLPTALSTFIGRERELRDVSRLLGSSRLVTLTGTAGVGKTRLALRVAQDRAHMFADGTWSVELAPVRDPCLVPQTIATAMSLREVPRRPVVETLLTWLRDRSVLLLLDNCEHLVGVCAELADLLLRGCPALRFLATSREPLGIPGEAAWTVPPLSVPAPTTPLTLDTVAVHDAVRLFVERTRGSGFSLTPSTAPIVAEICRRLDGIPLAIELAAARVGLLTPIQIASRLDDRFRLLTDGSRTAPPRHRTLQEALDWGHELLSPPEQTVLRRLAVFAGGWTLEAAEEVCVGEGLGCEEVFDVLGRLIAKSMVVSDTTGREARYRLLETVREYAMGKLAEAGETATARRAHAASFGRLVERIEAELSGPRQVRWLARLDTEIANIRAALDWSLSDGDGEAGLVLAGSLTLFWLARGHLLEGSEWLRRAADASGGAPASVRAKVLWGVGFLASMLGDFPASRAAAEESLTLCRESGDTQAIARSLNLLGVVATFQDSAAARPILEESLALAAEIDDDWCLAQSFGMLGWAETFLGSYPSARARFEECIAIARRAQERQGLRMGLLGRGYVALQQGEYEPAQTLLEEGLTVSRELGDTLWAGVALIYLAELHGARGDHAHARSLGEESLQLARESASRFLIPLSLGLLARLALAEGNIVGAQPLLEEGLSFPRDAVHIGNTAVLLLGYAEVIWVVDSLTAARPLLEEAVAVARQSGDRMVVSRALQGLGEVARQEGDRRRARALHVEALRLRHLIGQRPAVVESLEALAGLAAEDGRYEEAARILGAVQVLRDRMGHARQPADSARHGMAVSLARARLSPEEFSTAWQLGSALSMERVVAFACRTRTRRGASAGSDSLTRVEQEVVRLVAEGMTNAQVGGRLGISPRTVQAHLSHVFTKLNVRSRRQLIRGGGPTQ